MSVAGLRDQAQSSRMQGQASHLMAAALLFSGRLLGAAAASGQAGPSPICAYTCSASWAAARLALHLMASSSASCWRSPGSEICGRRVREAAGSSERKDSRQLRAGSWGQSQCT